MKTEQRANDEKKFFDVATSLGPDWQFIPLPNDRGSSNYVGDLRNARLRANLWVGRAWDQKGKYHITGEYPKDRLNQMHTRYGERLFNINVSCEKTAQRIADDIGRRLLPDYSARLAEIVKSVGDYNEFYAKKSAIGQRLRAEFSWLRLHDGPNLEKQPSADVTLDSGHEYSPRVKVNVYYDRIDAEIDNLTPDETALLLTLVEGLVNRGTRALDAQKEKTES